MTNINDIYNLVLILERSLIMHTNQNTWWYERGWRDAVLPLQIDVGEKAGKRMYIRDQDCLSISILPVTNSGKVYMLHPMLWARNSIGSMCPFFQPLEALCSLLNISPSAFLFREQLVFFSNATSNLVKRNFKILHVISVPSRNLTWHNTWNTQFQDPPRKKKKSFGLSVEKAWQNGTSSVRLVSIDHGITGNASCAWEHCSCCLKLAALAKPAARNIGSEF